MIYAKKALRAPGSRLKLKPSDPFDSKSNQAQLAEANQQFQAGHIGNPTMEELEALKNESDPFCGRGMGGKSTSGFS